MTTHQQMRNPSQDQTIAINNYQSQNSFGDPKWLRPCTIHRLSAPTSMVHTSEVRPPQAYKQFIKSCTLRIATGGPGSIREVMAISGLPAKTSMTRLDKLDDELHVIMVSIIGGDHRLENYHSTTRLHETEGGRETVVTESYVVDVPVGNSKEKTYAFADTITGCNLRSLARVTEKMVAHEDRKCNV